ncbi:MAG: lytic transglycosylase protein [Paucimonas sp.]|nr:lytic transglycosylase protein [Paucimonas sp.]
MALAASLSPLLLIVSCAGAGLHAAAPGPDDTALASSLRAARMAVETKPVRMQPMSAREVLREWGAMPGTEVALRRATAKSLAAADPGYLSISEILRSETCHGCEQKPFHHFVLSASQQHGVPPSLIHAVILKESRYNPGATSNRRARGLMQIMPGTGRFLGVQQQQHLYDPKTNIHAGTAYLKYLMERHRSVDEVLAAYNAGSGNVRKYKGVPPFAETRQYVRDVKRFYAATASPLGPSGAKIVAAPAEATTSLR